MKIELPIEIGQEVFTVPSEVNFKLNIVKQVEVLNKVYKQHIVEVNINGRGWYAICDLDKVYGNGNILLNDFFEETWFLSEDEAFKKLNELEEKCSYLRV